MPMNALSVLQPAPGVTFHLGLQPPPGGDWTLATSSPDDGQDVWVGIVAGSTRTDPLGKAPVVPGMS